jgi:hypothetical protein
MKIISVKKAEKQARAYQKENVVIFPIEWREEYISLEKERKKLHRAWDKIRDKKCPSNPNNKEICICKTLPEYPSFLAKLQPIVNRINAMYQEEHTANEQVYLNKLSELLSGIAARKKYLK